MLNYQKNSVTNVPVDSHAIAVDHHVIPVQNIEEKEILKDTMKLVFLGIAFLINLDACFGAYNTWTIEKETGRPFWEVMQYAMMDPIWQQSSSGYFQFQKSHGFAVVLDLSDTSLSK